MAAASGREARNERCDGTIPLLLNPQGSKLALGLGLIVQRLTLPPQVGRIVQKVVSPGENVPPTQPARTLSQHAELRVDSLVGVYVGGNVASSPLRCHNHLCGKVLALRLDAK